MDSIIISPFSGLVFLFFPEERSLSLKRAGKGDVLALFPALFVSSISKWSPFPF